ncbi:hypothetical protein Scep_028279 [Stephania cephalantha]|uniref:Uncharacterized protein n=1 Tax=Stephania cephalantha TaxID=152367 RepID=A0AAP0ECU6_9MAGN
MAALPAASPKCFLPSVRNPCKHRKTPSSSSSAHMSIMMHENHTPWTNFSNFS